MEAALPPFLIMSCSTACQNDLRTVFRKRFGDGFPDSPAGASDQGDFTVQFKNVAIHFSFFLSSSMALLFSLFAGEGRICTRPSPAS
jgi:hypothetical protein